MQIGDTNPALSRATMYLERAFTLADSGIPRTSSGDYGNNVPNPAQIGLSAARMARAAISLLGSASNGSSEVAVAMQHAQRGIELLELFATEYNGKQIYHSETAGYLRGTEALFDAWTSLR